MGALQMAMVGVRAASVHQAGRPPVSAGQVVSGLLHRKPLRAATLRHAGRARSLLPAGRCRLSSLANSRPAGGAFFLLLPAEGPA
jgi:hypothetical protein